MKLNGIRRNWNTVAVIAWPVIMFQVYISTVILMSRGLAGSTAHGAQEAIQRAEAMKHQVSVMVAVLVGEVVLMGVGVYFLAMRLTRKRGQIP